MDKKDLQKLRILLEHWIEHNEAHAEEFMEWADKAKELRSSAVTEKIATASDCMLKANESLRAAIKSLNSET